METNKLTLRARAGLFVGFIVGLLTLPVIAFLLIQVILLGLIFCMDSIKAVAFVIQFPATLFIIKRWGNQ